MKGRYADGILGGEVKLQYGSQFVRWNAEKETQREIERQKMRWREGREWMKKWSGENGKKITDGIPGGEVELQYGSQFVGWNAERDRDREM